MRRKRQFKSFQRQDSVDILYVSKYYKMIDCWMCKDNYKTLDGFKVYQKWAHGSGPVARHLCANSKCINPLHLVRGTEFDNAQDELDVRDFTIELFEEMMKDFSLRDLDIGNDLKIHVIIPRATIALREQYGFEYLAQTIRYGRYRFKEHFIFKLNESIENNSASKDVLERLSNAKEYFNSLRMRRDIRIEPITEVW